MAIYPSKTVCMTIGTQRKLSKLNEVSLSVQDITLQSVETLTCLKTWYSKVTLSRYEVCYTGYISSIIEYACIVCGIGNKTKTNTIV